MNKRLAFNTNFVILLLSKIINYLRRNDMGYRDNWFNENESNHGWYTCVRCGKKLRKGDVDIDHIIPQNRGGSDNINNLQCMCKHCNRSKQDDLDYHTVTDYARNVGSNTQKNIQNGLGRFFKK